MNDIGKAILFEKPDAIPMNFAINPSCYFTYPQDALFDLMADHKYLFPNFTRPKLPFVPRLPLVARENEPYTDDFGCVWMTPMDGLTGTVKGHPIDDWAKFGSYKFPDPEVCCGIGPLDWEAEAKAIRNEKEKNGFVIRGLRHGHTFLQLSDMRGYENLMFDMADEEPMLDKLIAGIEAFNTHIIEKYVALGADMLSFPEDLGMQTGPMLSPAHFKKYIQPVYRRMMAPARAAGRMVHMHSDGDIRLLVDDIIEGGVQCINLQDLVNGIDWIAAKFRGKVCVDLDIDRQDVTVHGTPKEIDDLIRREVASIGTPQGGLTMVFGLYPGTPLENVKAVMDAMEKYAGYFR